MKTDNEIISEALGHVPCDNWVHQHAGSYVKGNLNCKHEKCVPRVLYPRRYDKHGSLWDSKLYKFIEDEGLAELFCDWLFQIMGVNTPCTEKEIKYLVFAFTKTTPAQKASALATLLREKP